MACNCVSRKTARITLWVSMIIFIISVVFIVVFPTVYNKILKKELTLADGSIVSNIWQDIPLPIYERVYFFNITNSERFLKGEERMNLTEVGPYTYKSRWVKKHPHWHDNDTVTYKEKRTYHFVPEMSNGTLDDVIYTLNGPMIIAASIAKSYPKLLRAALSLVLGIEGEKIVIQRKIRELTYEGYDDFIIKYAPIIKSDIPFKEGKFCWLYGKNATNDGKYTVFTGVDDASKTGMINNWNGEERLNFWKGDPCNTLNGTSIEIGPPITEGQTRYTFYQSIFCRALTYNFTEEVEHFGIPTKRFRPTYDLFANSSENPNNYCFETNQERASGIMDISSCQYGAPVFISFPHFHMADPSYLKPIFGLNPNDDDHGSHLDVEKVTGFSVDISVKFQINVEIQNIEGIFQLEKVPKGIFPIIWVDLSLKLDQHFADFLKGHLNNPKTIAYSVLGVLAGLSLILAVLCFVKLHCVSDDDVLLIDARDDIARIYQNEIENERRYVDTSDDELLGKESTPRESSGIVNASSGDYGVFNKQIMK